MISLLRRVSPILLVCFLFSPSGLSAQEAITPPTIEFIGDRSVEVTQTLGINVRAYSQSQEIPWLWVESLPRGADFFDSGEGFRTFLWFPAADQVGQHTVKFIAADAQNQQIRTEREVVITVLPGNYEHQAFSIIAPDRVDAFVGKPLSVRIIATDSNGTVPALTAQWIPDGATLDDNGDGSRSLNWTPTADQFGTYNIRFIAVSANSPYISTGHDMLVSVIGRPPLISFPVSPGVEAGEVLSFPVRVTKPSGVVPSLTLSPLPSGASFNDNGDGSRQFTWLTTEGDIGSHIFLLEAIDPLTGLSSTIDLYVNVLSDSSQSAAQQTIELNAELLSLELKGAALDDPFDRSDSSLSATAGFLTNEAELLLNGDANHTVDLLPGINTVAIVSTASAQSTLLSIVRQSYPSVVPGSFPAAFAVDTDDQLIALSANVYPGERAEPNSADIYSLTESTLALEAYLGYETDFVHATSIDLSDDTLVLASRDAPQAGAWVYEKSDEQWQFKAHLLPDRQTLPEGSGTVVALDGNTLAVAALYDAGSSPTDPILRGTPGAGAVLMYERMDNEWRFQSLLKAPVPEFNDYFGSSLALEGDTLVVSAIGEDSDGTGVDSDPGNNGFQADETQNYSAGAVFVFERVDGEWQQTAYLKPSDNAMPATAFGHAVSVFEDTIAVSALYAPRAAEIAQAAGRPTLYGAGAVYIFDRAGNTWEQSAKLEPPANNWSFGLDIDLKKNQLMVLTQSRAYFHERHDEQWTLLWDENVSRSVVSFNHEAMIFSAPNNDTLVYSSHRRNQ